MNGDPMPGGTRYVVLPGMNGGDELLQNFIRALSPDGLASVISLPQSGRQDYPFLTGFVRERLPGGNFVLIAESFSGPIAAAIASAPPPALKGVVFVATFLSPPNRLALLAGQLLPVKRMLRLPFAGWLLKRLFVGTTASDALVRSLVAVIGTIPSQTLRRRTLVMAELQCDAMRVSLPACYLRPDRDRLVPRNSFDDFSSRFEKITCIDVPGPHALLQRHPGNSAELIRRLAASF